MAHEVHFDDSEDVTSVTALCYTGVADVYFTGKDDGSVSTHDANSDSVLQDLFRLGKNVTIVLMHFEQSGNNLITVDSSSRVTARRVHPTHPSCGITNPTIDHRTSVAVDQVLANRGSSRVLICSTGEDNLWSNNDDGARILSTLPWENRRSYAWKQHPTDTSRLILINGTILHMFDWNGLERLTGDEGILLEGSMLPELTIKYIMPCFNGKMIATAFVESLSPRSKSRILVWNTADFYPESTKAASIPGYQPLADQVECLIGVYKDRMVFLHTSGWVCFADASTFDLSGYIRHFFIPADWLSSSSELLMDVILRGTILFAKGNEVAVIKKGLDMDSSAPMGRRPSLMPRHSSTSPSPFRGRFSLGRHRDSN